MYLRLKPLKRATRVQDPLSTLLVAPLINQLNPITFSITSPIKHQKNKGNINNITTEYII